MVFFNHATRQMTAKIVYYGPGLCGKTTNLNTIYGKTSQKARGEMVSLNTETDRTLFFDLLPMDVGMVGGFKTKLQLYTVPGQVFNNSTRKLVLKGVDGIVFVVDSQLAMFDASKESYQNLNENLRELGLNLQDIPTVFQWNKRDLKNVVPVEELEAALNPRGLPSFQSVAADGTGVFETLRGITKLALSHIKQHVMGDGTAPQAVAPPSPSPVMAPPQSGAGEALTFSDLPSVTDLLDMDDQALPGASGSLPLPDEDDDTGFYIEAPVLPEPPEAAAEPQTAASPASAIEEPDFQPLESPEPVAQSEVPAPVHPDHSPHISIPVAHTKPMPKVDPLAAMASLKMEPKRPATKSKSLDHKDAINTLLGELTQVGRLGAPSVLRLELPAALEGENLEVVVLVRQNGQVVAEGQIARSAPAKGATAKLTVELKRG